MNRTFLTAAVSLLATFGVPDRCSATTAPARGPAEAAHRAPLEEKVIEALRAWLKAYRAGKIDFTRKDSIAKDSIAQKFGLLPKGLVGDVTYERELDILFELAVKLESAEAAGVLLQFAAIGLDDHPYTRSMAPYAVRARAEEWLGRFKGPAAKDEIARTAKGEVRIGNLGPALAAAALRVAGLRRDADLRPMLEQQLGAKDLPVRLAAAEGLGHLGEEAAGAALAGALERETTDQGIEAIVQALRRCYAKYLAPPATDTAAKPAVPQAPESARLAVRAAIASLGRTNWRADMALVQFLDDFRSPETIPALIAILQKCKDNPAEMQSGKLSGLLLHRAHEALVSMTGAVFPADRPEQWREFWETEKGKIQVVTRTPAGEAGKPGANTVATGFCGIPVQGTRVVFILDLSGSMDFPMRSKGTVVDGKVPDKLPSRLDFAKKELLRAMDQLSSAAQFNLVTFNGNPKPEVWSKALVPANEKNRERFRKYVTELKAVGATNLWCGLEEGLKLKSLVYGDRYDTNVDELFILSDGAPTTGDVMDPIEILRLVQETNRFSKVRINTAFITSPDPKETPPTPWMTITPEELMKRMAEQNGGKFVNL